VTAVERGGRSTSAASSCRLAFRQVPAMTMISGGIIIV
jgi:hypothetical protein